MVNLGWLPLSMGIAGMLYTLVVGLSNKWPAAKGRKLLGLFMAMMLFGGAAQEMGVIKALAFSVILGGTFGACLSWPHE